MFVPSLVLMAAWLPPAHADPIALDLTDDFGIRIQVTPASFYSARSTVAPAGDLNMDGVADLLIGDPAAGNNGRRNSGSVYVLYGSPTDYTIDLRSLPPSRGYRIDGARPGDRLGTSVASIGNLNRDSIPDGILGAPGADHNRRARSGSVYVMFGHEATRGNIDLARLPPRGFGYRIDGGSPGELLGTSVTSAGYLNADRRPDVLLSALHARYNGRQSGSVYAVYLPNTPRSGNVDLATLASDRGYRIDGAEEFDYAGAAIANAGDMNADGLADALIGAPHATGEQGGAGTVFVIYGRPAGSFVDVTIVDLATLDASQGYRIDGPLPYEGVGWSTAGIGDMNGDGWLDVLVGALYASDSSGDAVGAAYVIFGRESPVNVSLASLSETVGYRLVGEIVDGAAGFEVASAGDVNGDQIPDVLIGAPWTDVGGTSAGSAYVVYGRRSAEDIHLGELGLTEGYRADGPAFAGYLGTTLADGGDMNGDGFHDAVVGSSASGTYYVIFGRSRANCSIDRSLSTQPVTIVGTFRSDGICGGSGPDTIYANPGNDTIDGGDGNDFIYGGAGADTVNYAFAPGGVFVDLAMGSASGARGTDSLASIESVLGSGFDDVLIGSDEPNVLEGGGGNDELIGGRESDILIGGLGDDRLDGGGGIDTCVGSGNDILVGCER